jgi:hypothetical protein
LSSIAAAADAIAVPPMPTKWTDLISEENISKIKPPSHPGTKFFDFLVSLCLGD